MERIIETHDFGPHRVVVVEHVGDDDRTYSILVDDCTVTDPPLPAAPSLEDLVRIYAHTVGSS